jgi:hypothetical protein
MLIMMLVMITILKRTVDAFFHILSKHSYFNSCDSRLFLNLVSAYILANANASIAAAAEETEGHSHALPLPLVRSTSSHVQLGKQSNHIPLCICVYLYSTFKHVACI